VFLAEVWDNEFVTPKSCIYHAIFEMYDVPRKKKNQGEKLSNYPLKMRDNYPQLG